MAWLHEKWTFKTKRERNKIYVGTHDTYTKVQGCKTLNNLASMYTSIMKLLMMWPKEVIWSIYSSHKVLNYYYYYIIIIIIIP